MRTIWSMARRISSASLIPSFTLWRRKRAKPDLAVPVAPKTAAKPFLAPTELAIFSRAVSWTEVREEYRGEETVEHGIDGQEEKRCGKGYGSTITCSPWSRPVKKALMTPSPGWVHLPGP